VVLWWTGNSTALKKTWKTKGTTGTYLRIACQVLAKHAKLSGDEQPDEQWKIAEYYRIEPEIDIDLVTQSLVQYGSFMAACP
jgi:hypothetical protein